MTREPTGTYDAQPHVLRAKLEELRGYVAAVGLERLKDGSWFDEFVRAMLHAYHAEAEAAGANKRFATRFSGRDTGAVADVVVEEAA